MAIILPLQDAYQNMFKSERVISRFEVGHVASFDILVNTRQTSVIPEELDTLRVSIVEDIRTFPNDKPFSLWHQSPDHSRIRISNTSKPRYVAKEKWITPDHPAIKEAVMIDRKVSKPLQADYKSSIYSLDSIFSEMSVATIMMNIVQTENVRLLFRDVGVGSIDFVEPLIGVIDRKSGKKYVVYEHKNGIQPHIFFKSNYEGLFEIKRAVKRFAGEIEKYLVEPHDMDEWQFLYEEDRGQIRMHMIDIEMYSARHTCFFDGVK